MESAQIKFVPGQFQSFITTRKFALGNSGAEVQDGMEVLFDGTTAEVAGTRFTLPQLRGAVKAGWLVPAESYDAEAVVVRPSANIQVRPAVNMNSNPLAPPQRSPITTAETDEQVVMTRGQRTAAAQQQTQQARGNRTAAAQPARGAGVARSFNGNLDVDAGGAEYGIPVGRTLLTPAKAVTEVTRDSVGQAIMAADKVKVQPGQGITEEEMLSRMSPEDQEAYLAKKEAARAGVTSRLNPNYSGPAVTQYEKPAHGSRVVGSVKTARTQSSEGISAKVTTGGGTEVYDPTGTGGQVQETVVESEGIRFSNTNGPKKGFQPLQPAAVEEPTVSKIEKDGTAEARKQIAKAICPDFPADQYNFSDHWKRRLAMIRLNYEGRADIIRAIFAAESDDFKKVLFEEFPDVFA